MADTTTTTVSAADNKKVVKVLADELTKAMKTISAKEAYIGTITADMIKSGTMSANRINGGTLTLGGDDNGSGVLLIRNASGTEIGKWDNSGITINNGSITVNGGGTFNSITVQGNSTFAGRLSGATGTFSGNLTAISTRFNEIVCTYDAGQGGGVTIDSELYINNHGINLPKLWGSPFITIGDTLTYGWHGEDGSYEEGLVNGDSVGFEVQNIRTGSLRETYPNCCVTTLNLSPEAKLSVLNQLVNRISPTVTTDSNGTASLGLIGIRYRVLDATCWSSTCNIKPYYDTSTTTWRIIVRDVMSNSPIVGRTLNLTVSYLDYGS